MTAFPEEPDFKCDVLMTPWCISKFLSPPSTTSSLPYNLRVAASESLWLTGTTVLMTRSSFLLIWITASNIDNQEPYCIDSITKIHRSHTSAACGEVCRRCSGKLNTKDHFALFFLLSWSIFARLPLWFILCGGTNCTSGRDTRIASPTAHQLFLTSARVSHRFSNIFRAPFFQKY